MGELDYFVGVDGCRGGWIAIALSKDGQSSFQFFPDLVSLWKSWKTAELILIDIPIGLRENGTEERLCDIEARKRLGPGRASSVFRAPCRGAIYSKIDEASQVNENFTGKKLPKQCLAILPKIREADELLVKEPEAKLKIREMHPEVCFWGLNGCRPLQHSKKLQQGRNERLAVLEHTYPQAGVVYANAGGRFWCSQASEDDILDALAGAVTSCQGLIKLETLPQKPELDARGLPMEMVYAKL